MTTPPFARYRQVADRLRHAIQAGEYEPGQALPSESRLAEEFGLNRTTINRAVRLLAAEGLVTIEHGRGSFVRRRRPTIHTSAAYVTREGGADRAQWKTVLERQGFAGTQRIREVSTEDPPAEIAGHLGLEDGDQVIVRKRVMLLDDEPVQVADSYYPARLASGTELAETARMPGGTIAALERLGVDLVRFRETVTARMPTPDEAGLLGIAQGMPVLRLLRVAYDAAGAAVEACDMLAAADRHVLAYDLPATVAGEYTSEDASTPERPPVVAAIVTSADGVLVGRRIDGKPPWTFIAGEIEPGESPADAVVREVKEETGLRVVAAEREIGRRVHPKTGRTMIYLACSPTHKTDVYVGDPDELAEVRWVSLGEADELLPGVFEPVRRYLAEQLAE